MRWVLALATLTVLGAGCTRLGFRPDPDAEPRGDRGSVDRLAALDGASADAPAEDVPRGERRQADGADLARRELATHADLPTKDVASKQDLTQKDLSSKKDLVAPKDLPLAKDLPPKDLPPRDLAKDLASKDLPAKDKSPLKVDGLGSNPSGTYSLAPQVSYKCAFAVVDFTINWVILADTGSALTVTTGPTGPKGGCNVLVGDTAFDGSFTATCTYPGTCNETYSLAGTMSGTSFSGTYTASYSGSCLNCVNQSWAVTAIRQ